MSTGLRERKIARTRAQIVEEAVQLFLDKGYEATTMEEVAERAEVGTSTLYRYFPSKELLLLDPFARMLDFAHLLRGMPHSEPLGRALGRLLREAWPGRSMAFLHRNELWAMVQENAGPRARLWYLVQQANRDLEEAIAERLDLDREDFGVIVAARFAITAYDVCTRDLTATATAEAWRARVDDVLARLAMTEPVLPI